MTPEIRFLLEQLAGEAAEVAHIALKAAQFGPSEVMPGQPLDNFQRITGELNDLFAVVEMLSLKGLGLPGDAKAILAKQAKVRRYMDFALYGAPHPMAGSAPEVGKQ